MKKTLIALLLLLAPSLALAQVFTTHQGGTGLVDISSGSIPFGSLFNIRMATSSVFQFNNTASRLSVTYASTTGVTAGKFFGALVGNADTATAFFSTPTKCSVGNYTLGIDVNGNAQGCTAAGTGTVTSVTAAFPLASSGSATPNITSLFSTTTNNGMTAGFLYSGSGGIWQTAASSSFFGYTPLNPTRNINTTYPITGGGDLSADRTIASAFGTTTTWGMGNNGLVMTGATGIPFSQATSSALAISISGNAATVTTNANLSGVVTSSGNTTSYGSQAAGVLGNSITGNTAPMATSTLYGAVQSGKILAGLANGTLAYVATSTNSCTTVTCVYANGVNTFTIGANALALSMLPTQALNTVLANGTSATAVPSAIATSTFFGVSTPGFILANTSAGLALIASTTYSGTAPITTSFAAGQLTVACASCLTANQSITLSGAVTGSGATAITTAFGTLSQGILGNPANAATIPTAQATSTLYGNYSAGTYGSMLSWDGSKLVLMATTSYSGTTGQFPFFSATNNLIGTSSIFASTKSFIGVSSTTPFSVLSIGTGLASSSVTVAEYKYGATGGLTNVATSTAMQVDCNASTQIAVPIGFSATTLTLVNMTPGKTCRVVVQNPGGTAGAITWAISGGILKWAGGTTPTQTLTANSMDVWSFLGTSGSSTMQVNGAQSANF